VPRHLHVCIAKANRKTKSITQVPTRKNERTDPIMKNLS
jgi:hypothetical protein